MLHVLLVSMCLHMQECKDAYLDMVLKSENYGRYYLVIKTNNGYQEKEIVVLNLNLYEYLAKENKSIKNINNYVSFVKNKLLKDEPIQITNDGLKSIQAVFVKTDSSVIKVAEKGREYFLNEYFDVSSGMMQARMKLGVPAEKIAQITKILFQWNYPIGTIEMIRSVTDLNFCKNTGK